MPSLPESPEGEPATWRWLGRLDAAARTGRVERVLEFADDPRLETVLPRADAGRLALRTLGRSLLASDREDRLYDLYVRHLAATNDEGSRKDADTLLGDAVRRADDALSDGAEAEGLASLERSLVFATTAGLEGRVGAKIERKIGRAHQLEGRFEDATKRYRAALARLDADDRYRSVLQGDLALAALGVRGTLDLMPTEGRTGTEDVERLLTEEGAGGEGESYNAIYTLGVLAYERGDFAKAAERFREADRLMRETRAKARIVHARARFFLGASMLKMGVSGEQLVEAEGYVIRDSLPASLDPAIKQPIFDLLLQLNPQARITGGGGGRGRDGEGAGAGRGDRGGRGRRGRGGRDRDGRGGPDARDDRGPGDPNEGFVPIDTALEGVTSDGGGGGGGAEGVGTDSPPRVEGVDGAPAGEGRDDGRGGRRRGRRGRGGRGGGERGGDRGGERGPATGPHAAERLDRYSDPRPPTAPVRPDVAGPDGALPEGEIPADAGLAQTRSTEGGREGRGGRGTRGGRRGRGGEGRGGEGRGERRPPERRLDESAPPGAPISTGASDGSTAGPVSTSPTDTVAAGHLAEARRFLDMDSHHALRCVDEAFKSRPGFEDWYAAYRIRLEALLRLGETAEGIRTFERFRAKLHERGRAERLEELLLDGAGPLGELMDDTRQRAELVDLYDTMTGRERPFAEAATALANIYAEEGDAHSLHEAVALLREAIAKGSDEAHTTWADVGPRARAAGVPVDGAELEAVKAKVAARGAPVKIVVLAGDESSRPHEARLSKIAHGLGIEAVFVMGGARPPARTLEDLERAIEGAVAVIVLHNAGMDLRDGVRAAAEPRGVAVKELPFAGAVGFEPEVLAAIDAVL